MKSEFFTGNRERLSKLFPEHLLLIPAHTQLQRTGDTPYKFRQDSNHWYFCGQQFPDAILVINSSSGGTTLLLPEFNDYQLDWEFHVDESVIKRQSGVQAVSTVKDLDKLVSQAQSDGLKIGMTMPLEEVVEPFNFYSNPFRAKVLEQLSTNKVKPVDIRLEISRLRMVKQDVEIALIQKAIDATALAMSKARDKLKAISNEADMEKFFTAQLYLAGSDGHSFDPIIASGKNAALIHHKDNSSDFSKTDGLLLDVGGIVDGYCADISRVWCNQPSERLTELYEGLKAIQEYAITLLKPGTKMREYQKSVEAKSREVFEGLNCSVPDQYPHGVSHFLGFDVHDAGDYSMPLQAGIVMTVEPGIYLPDEGIGLRIEDDVLITSDGVKILSASIPRVL
ncbi:MAG: Xaa-Pro aminopeptidase [Candidatus Saccharimonadales bacterium]|jgi:Xaa-Pro aminopeptidase